MKIKWLVLIYLASIIVVIYSTCLCVAAFIVVTYIPQNITVNHNLSKLTSRLESYPLPANSEIIDVENSLSKNGGNGDYCIYLVRLTISTTSDSETIRAFYQDATIPSLYYGDDSPLSIWLDIPPDQTTNGQMEYTIEINDMTETVFDLGCKKY